MGAGGWHGTASVTEASDEGAGDNHVASAAPPARGGTALPALTAFCLYLIIAVSFWWRVWSTHPSTYTTCGCGDNARYLWFLEWPVYAIGHGHNVLYSTWLFHPTGLNLLSDTGVLAFGIILAPITWVFGPIASLNVGVTLIPVLSASSMFWLLKRWVSWSPAAFVGGLLYGFSPYIFSGLVSGWLNIMLAIPPLMVACLDELCVRNRRRPLQVGITLGAIVAVEFFVSTEQLAISAITIGIGLVAFGSYAAVRHFGAFRRRARRAVNGMAAAIVTGLVLLAYPIWFALAGPGHFSGRIWPGQPSGFYGVNPAAFFHLTGTGGATSAQHRYGGYQGTALHQSTYLGAGLAIVLVLGTIVWRKDRRLWLLALVALATMWLCLSPFEQINHFWVPWRILAHIPIAQNILPVRFVGMTFFAVAAMLAIVVEHTRDSTARLVDRTRHSDRRKPVRGRTGGSPLWLPRLLGVVMAAAVAIVAVAAVASTYAGNVPLAASPVVVPLWFRLAAPRLPPRQVLLTYPSAYGGLQAPIAWQAIDRMSFAMVGGDGPGSVIQRAGAERPGYTVLVDDTFALDPATAYRMATVSKVRRALAGWKATMVVIPDQPRLPAYDKGNYTAYSVALTTMVVGSVPRYEDKAWVWKVPSSPRSLVVTPAAFEACTGTANFPSGAPESIPKCLVAASQVLGG